MGGKSGSAQIQVADYHLSQHFGVCVGPVDEVKAILIQDKDIGIEPFSQSGSQVVDKRSLFGGNKSGGGISGLVRAFFGNPDQLIPSDFAARLGGTPTTLPGFRGILSLLFTGTVEGGFLWGSNNPTMPPVAVVVKCGWRSLDDDPFIGEDMNPIHIIYECLVNTDWGMGGSPDELDKASYLAAAQVMRDEEFGLSLMWSRATPIESFIGEILDHIDASHFINPRTGLLTIKLLRKDYEVDDLPVISPDNARLTNFQRTAWAESANEINVSWTNPENEEEETVTVHDNANIAIQGGVVSDSRNYYGARNPTLAARLGNRDLNAAAAALASCDVEMNRLGWDLVPGSVAVLYWPEHGIQRMIVRVGAIDYGKPGSPAIKFSVIEDIFGLPHALYTPPSTQWVNPDQQPQPLEIFRLGATPYFVLVAVMGDADAQAMEYPETRSMILATQQVNERLAIDLLSEMPDIVGNIAYRPAGSTTQSGYGELTSNLGLAETSDIFPLVDYFGPEPEAGMLVLIAADADAEVHELCAIESASESSIVIRRGVLDTVPRNWPSGSKVWLIEPILSLPDSGAKAVGQEVKYRFLPYTSLGRLPVEFAPIETVTIDDRHYRPYRPANMRINGTVFGPMTVGLGAVNVTWSRRNRLMETSVVLKWTDADVAPEAGQTTTLQVLKGGIVLDEYTDIEGTAQSVNLEAITEIGIGDVIVIRLIAVRDGFTSLQSTDIVATVAPNTGGYGNNWGNIWG